LILAGQISRWDHLLLVVASNVVIAWLFMASGRSVLLVMVLRATNNAFSVAFVSQLFTGADASRQAAITAVIWAVAAGSTNRTKACRQPTPSASYHCTDWVSLPSSRLRLVDPS